MTAPRALVVDDVRTNRSLLRALLEEDGFEVSEAGDGIEAVSMYRTVRPSVVLMDVMLPKLDGYAATRVIKELAGEELVTVIMVTSVSQDQVLRGIESGADDFLLRPFKPQALRARLAVWRRVRDLLAVVRGQRDELAAHEAVAEAERERVVGIFRRIVGTTLPAGIDAVASPATIFNGDVVLAAETPTGQLRVLVGDFTGHGLTAAMGALPAAETFREATRSGASIEELTVALDRRLQGFLPVGMFFAVGVIELDRAARCARVVNLGMPPILFVSPSTTLRFASTGPPLGIPIPMREVHAAELGLTADSVLVACTDGVIEAQDANGKQFEVEGVLRALRGVAPDKMVAALRDALRAHSPGEQNDDISFAVISPMVRGTSQMADSLDERLVWRLDAERLRDELTLPKMFEDIARAPWTTRFNGELQTVLAELYANSLDYGVLGLSSKSKRNLSTYGDYMMARGAALEALREGTITIQLSLGTDGESLILELEDSGAGFEPPTASEHIAEALVDVDLASPPSGRGIAMVQAIASEVTYSKEGRAVRVVLREAPQRQAKAGSATARAPDQHSSALAIAFDAVLSTEQRAILVEDANRNIVAVNNMFCDMFHLAESPRQLVGKDCLATLVTLMPSLAEPDAFVLRIAELVEARAPVLHDEIVFADGTTCHRDYHPLSSGLHLWCYRPTAGIELLMPDQIDSREDAIDVDLRSRLELAHHGLGRAQERDPTDLVASVGFAAAFDGHRLVELMETTRTVWRQGHYEATPMTGDVNELAPHLASAVSESGVTVELVVRSSGYITTWPKTIEGVLDALVGGGCYARCADDATRVTATIDFTGGGIALGSVKAPRQWSNEEGETMRRVRSTVASLLAVRVGGGLEHEVDDGMDKWTFWVPATGAGASDGEGEHHVGAMS